MRYCWCPTHIPFAGQSVASRAAVHGSLLLASPETFLWSVTNHLTQNCLRIYNIQSLETLQPTILTSELGNSSCCSCSGTPHGNLDFSRASVFALLHPPALSDFPYFLSSQSRAYLHKSHTQPRSQTLLVGRLTSVLIL